jgi:hypothetical protein
MSIDWLLLTLLLALGTCAGQDLRPQRISLEIDGVARSWELPRHTRPPGVMQVDVPEPRVRWSVRFSRNKGGTLITSMLHNTSPNPVKIGKATLFDAPAPGVAATAGVALVMSGWQGPSLVKRTGRGPHLSKTLTVITEPGSSKGLLSGFTGFVRANTEHRIAADGAQVRLQSYCDFEGFPVAPNGTLTTEPLLVQTGEPIELLHIWADRVQQDLKPRIWPTIPAGWVGWSWVDPFRIEQYEEVLRRNAKAVRERLAGFDIGYLWVSLGNLENREPGNWLKWNTRTFPTPPRELIRDLNAQGFQFGLWMGAFWISSQLKDEVARLEDAFLRKDGKPLTVPHRELGAVYILDPTHPKTHEHLRKVLATYREWGVRYYMIDFLYSISGSTPGNFLPSSYFNRDLIPGPETYRDGLKVIRDAVGADTYLLASTGPTLHSIGLMDGVRAGTDYGEGRPLDGPGKGFWPATFVINKPDFWTSHQRATEAMATHFFMHRKLFVADTGNVLSVDQPIPVEEARMSTTIFGINGSPVMLGDDIARMSEDRVSFLRKVFPRLPEVATPLDLFESPEPSTPGIFHLPVKTSWDEYDLYAVFNYTSQTVRRRIAASEGKLAWDFWNERYLGGVPPAMEVEAPAESVRLLRVMKRRDHPWLLSTDMHVRQGQAEIVDAKWEAGALTIAAQRPAGSKGSVFVHAPKGFAPADPKGLFLAKDGVDGSLIIRVAMEFDAQGKASRTLRFSQAE